jgi:hypothetical protein
MTTEILHSDPALAEHAAEIRRLGKRVVADVIEIGRRLGECRLILKGEGCWRAWLDSELRLSPQTAGRFIQVHELSQGRSNLEHLDLPVSALYQLAAPSTPTEARDAVLDLAANGEPLTHAQVKHTIDTAKGRKQPVKRSKRETSRRRLKSQNSAPKPPNAFAHLGAPRATISAPTAPARSSASSHGSKSWRTPRAGWNARTPRCTARSNSYASPKG